MRQRGPARILVVDDEPGILRSLRTLLTRFGYQVETVETGQQALDYPAPGRLDLVLLDLGLPDMDGLDVIREWRQRANTPPIVVLSVRGAERSKVAALNLGADDYVTKPFGADELLARVRVAIRHAAQPQSGEASVFRTGRLEVDLELHRVSVDGKEIHLTPTEFRIFKVFVSYPNKMITERMLLQQAWGPEYSTEAHYIHVYMARLRQKLESDPRKPRYLVNEPGVGYRLLVEER